jgi:hypothetical protein
MTSKIVTPREVIAAYETHKEGTFRINIRANSGSSKAYRCDFIDLVMRMSNGDFAPIILREPNLTATIGTVFKDNGASTMSQSARITWNPTPDMCVAVRIIERAAVEQIKALITIQASAAPAIVNQYRRAISEMSGFKLLQTTRKPTATDFSDLSEIQLDLPIMRASIPYYRANNALDMTRPTWITVRDPDGVRVHPMIAEINAAIPRGSTIKMAFSLGPIVLSAPGGRQTVSMRVDVQGISVVQRGDPQSDRSDEIIDELDMM